MPAQISKKNSSLPLLIGLLVLVLIGGGYYFYTNIMVVTPVQEAPKPLAISPKVDWEKQIYNDPTYVKLVNPLPGPIESGPTGNPRPFIQIAPSEARK